MDIVKRTQKKVEQTKKKLVKSISLKSYRKLAVNFLILSINLIIIILYFALSRATIQIIPAKETISYNTSIPIRNAETAQETGAASIPGNIVTIPMSGSLVIPVEAADKTPAQATGELTIYNTTPSRNQQFVVNTRFVNAEGIELKISKGLQLGPGKEAMVSAFASEPGMQGEVTAESGRFQVAALPYLADKIYAEVSTPFTGGAKAISTVTQELLTVARKQLEQRLRDEAYEQLKKQSSATPPKNELIISIESFTTTANPGDVAEEFTAQAIGTASMFVYNAQLANDIVKQQLVKTIPPDKIFIDFDENSFSAKPDEDGKTIKTQIDAIVQQKIPDQALNPEDIIGLNREEVWEHFTRVTGIRDVQIKFSPFWVRSVPNLKDHVSIEVKQ